MVKLTSLKTKTAIEVTDNDLLVIEDKEDTKTITVEQFKIAMGAYNEQRVKLLFNDCLDKMKRALEQSKFIIPTLRKYAVNSWIGSTSGNVQITLRSLNTGKWLTRDELAALIMDEEGNITSDFKVELFAGGIYNQPESYQLLNFVDYHDRGVNEWLYDSNAGFIKVAFGTLEQNAIAAIRHDDIKVSIENRIVNTEDNPDNVEKEYEFVFITSADSFANSVEYVSVIPPGDPAWLS